MNVRRIGLALAACLVFSVPSLAQEAESTFHRAYFLERERGDLQGAMELYRGVAASREASAALKSQAQERLAGLEEELASENLAGLMPSGALLYAELSQPGQSLLRVLGQLGLTGSFEEAAAKGTFRVRPEMVRALIGIRGLALALTRLPENGGTPGGVLVANTGEVEILRGLIEAGVLAQGRPAEPIQGCPSWSLEGGVQVAVGRRLIVLSDSRAEIEGVFRRAKNPAEPSLATDPTLSAQLGARGEAPFFCCVNAVPLRPMLKGLLAARRDPGAAVLAAALDVDSLRALVAHITVGEDGLSLETDLFLEEDHRNLVFNLLRHAPIDPGLLDRIPKGVAAFVAGAFNERGPAIVPLEHNAGGAPVVSAGDFGREIFANLAGISLFVMPGGAPIPSAALLLSSNDPARTEAVLGLLLGLVNVYSTGASVDGETGQIAGEPTRVYRLPLGLPLYLTTHEDTLILSPSEELIELALESRTSGNSVLHDEAFAGELGRLGKDTTLALCAHLGRCLEVAQPFLPAEQRTRLQPFIEPLGNTVVALRERHSEARLGFVLALHGLPRIDGLVGEALARQRQQGSVARLVPGGATQGVAALVEAKEVEAKEEALMPRFARLAASKGNEDAARALARRELPQLKGDGRALNNFAWALLTEEDFAGRFDDLALEFARAANEATENSVWQYLDTFALASFRAGSVREAIALEERALGLVEASADRKECEASLARFRAAHDSLADQAHPR